MADLQKLKDLLSRLARRPSLLITSLFAVLASASKFLDWGVRLLDWVQRVEYLQGHQTGVVSFLRWFVSPTGADLVFVIALIAFFFAVILAVNKGTTISPDGTLAPIKKEPVTEQPKPKLDFEIDESESGVSAIRGGSHVSRITADINLRCEKETDSIMVVRTFHLSLHRLEADGKVTLIPYQQEAQVIWESSKGKLVPFKDGWTIDKPRSEFRHYSLTIEITPQAQKELSPDHFLGLTLDAIGQDLVSKTIYVKDWTQDNSPISLKQFEVFSPAAQKEIKQLKGKLKDYEETNAKLGENNQEHDWLTQEAKNQRLINTSYLKKLASVIWNKSAPCYTE